MARSELSEDVRRTIKLWRERARVLRDVGDILSDGDSDIIASSYLQAHAYEQCADEIENPPIKLLEGNNITLD